MLYEFETDGNVLENHKVIIVNDVQLYFWSVFQFDLEFVKEGGIY